MNDVSKIVIAAIIGLVVLLVVLNWNGDADWSKDYKTSKDRPYDISVFYNIMDHQYGSSFDKLETDFSTLDSIDQGKTLVCIGPGLHIGINDLSPLLDWVDNGNNAFLSLEVMPRKLLEAINDTIDFYEIMNSKSTLFLELSFDILQDKELAVQNEIMDSLNAIQFKIENNDYIEEFLYDPFEDVEIENNDVYEYWYKDSLNKSYDYWSLFNKELVAQLNCEYMGYNYETPNYIKINWGNGNIFLHTTPRVFTNYFLRDTHHLAYTEKILSHINDDNILWDNKNIITADRANRENYKSSIGDDGNRSSDELSYILSKRSWSKAWYLLMFTVVLFLIFNSLRKQRIIPVVWEKENKSKIHLNKISDLYINGGNHKLIAKYLIQFFDENIYSLYRIKIDQVENAAELLSEKSGVDIYLFEKLLKMRVNLKEPKFVNENTLIRLNGLINEFNKKRR